MSRHPLRILTGPTASGKTALALEWARRNDGWILSCDALLFYRGADIGTAKPTEAERREVPHFGIDLSPPDRAFDLPGFIDYALAMLRQAVERGTPVLVVGGSGFYLAAFHGPPPDPVAIPASVRDSVRQIADSGGATGLRKALLAVDPEAGAEVDLSNPRRTAPALERCLATGLPTRILRERHADRPCPFADWERLWFQVDPGDRILAERIARRTTGMLERGLVEEVRRLRAAGIERNPTLARAIGYRETLDHLAGGLDREELETAINLNTLRLARRQRKWIRNRLPETERIAERIP